MAKRKRNMQVTPKGVLVFPTFHTPDTKFDADGVYKTDLKLTGDEAEQFKAKVAAWHKEAVAEAKRQNAERAKEKGKKPQPVKENNLPVTENEDGSLDFRFKMPAKITLKDGPNAGKVITLRPALVDAALQPIPASTKVGGGSVARVSFEPRFYNTPQGAGVKLSLYGAQIIELKTWGGALSGAAMGFTAEDGFSKDELEEENLYPDESEPESGDEDAPEGDEPEGSGDF